MKIRTGYSFNFAFGHLHEVISRLQELGWTSAPITDRASTFGYVKWTKAAKAAGLKPIYGVELPVVTAIGDKSGVTDYWTFVAKDDLEPINGLIRNTTLQAGKHGALTLKEALSVKGVFKIAGHLAEPSLLPKDGSVFLPLGPGSPHALISKGLASGLPFIATNDNVYPRIGDRELYRIVTGRQASVQTYPQHILTHEEWAAAVGNFGGRELLGGAVENMSATMAVCRAELKQAELMAPPHEFTLEQMCRAGAAKLGCDLMRPEYEARLIRELELIAAKKFEDYFFIISDMMRWARARMICGPARGSSCGSLVCYLLEITTIDPIPFGLIFERFIDINRKDNPDIDLDFDDLKREKVFAYMEDKYGRDRVAKLGTVTLYKPRSVLKEVGGALGIPRWDIEKVLDSIIERSSGDSRALQAVEDTLKDTDAGRALLAKYPEIAIAGRLEGHPNNASTHAAGIVVTADPVRHFVAVDSTTRSTHCDKKDAEALNLLKIDALGLTQLSIFSECARLIGKPDVGGWMENIPLDDQAAFDVLNRGHWAGIFQFNGKSLQSITKQINVTHFEDIVSITALARPGPINSGGTNIWIGRKNGTKAVDYFHPIFEPYLKNTLGIVVYQEDVLNIGRYVGDLSWEDVTALRQAMSKSLGEEYFDKYGDPWKRAVVAKGVPKEVADEVWKGMCAFGSWSMNRSHCVAYGVVSYWCCWMKAHHPVEFAAATLSAEQDPVRTIGMLRELREEGVSYVAFDKDLSTEKWRPATREGKKILIGPLTNVKGIGPATMHEILRARRDPSIELRPATVKKLNSAKTTIDSLEPIEDAVRKLWPDLREANIVTTPTAIIRAQCGIQGDVVIIGVADKIGPKDENEVANVAKRGGRRLTGPTQSLNLFIRDDTDTVFAKIDRFAFERMGREVVERGKPGKAIYAVRGWCPPDFRMIKIRQIKYLGDVE